MKNYFLKSGNTYRVTSEAALDIHPMLPIGTYVVKFNSMGGHFYLEEAQEFRLPKVLYGDIKKNADRILNTFLDRKGATGVLLCGDKGSGKTLLAKLISSLGKGLGISTILVNTPFHGDAFNTFINDIQEPCIVFFDEFEKIYDRDEQQPSLLTLLDGVYTGKKMYLLTANDKYRIDSHMKNRPGRLFYFLEFEGLSEAFVRSYCEANLHNLTHLNQILVVASLFAKFNFDMLQALVEEVNRYQETPRDAIEILNVKPDLSSEHTFDVFLKVDGKDIPQNKLMDESWSGNPMAGLGGVRLNYLKVSLDADGEEESEWEQVIFTNKNIIFADMAKGIFSYEKNGLSLVLKQIQEQAAFDYRKYAF